MQPVVTRYKNTIRKERTFGVLSIQRENGNGTNKYSEKVRFSYKQTEKKERNTCGYRGACISKDDWTKGRGFNESQDENVYLTKSAMGVFTSEKVRVHTV